MIYYELHAVAYDFVCKRRVRCLAYKSVGGKKTQTFKYVLKRISHGLGLDMIFIQRVFSLPSLIYIYMAFHAAFPHVDDKNRKHRNNKDL